MPVLSVLAALAVVAAAPAASPELGALLERSDAAWLERDDPARLAASNAALEEAARLAPDEYAVLWRLSRRDSWLSDDPATDARERSRIGKQGWEVAERAIRRDPTRVEGYFYAALGMGNYALALGVIRALREGIEGKFKNRLARAESIEPGYLAGTIPVAWGRFWFELPWPKYDARRSEEALRRALRINPASVRARVYLAELYLKEGRRPDARTALTAALERQPGAYDRPEERRMQDRARQLLATIP